MPAFTEKRAVVALLALAVLSACSRTEAPADTSGLIADKVVSTDVEKNTSWVRGEFLKAETGDTPMAGLFAALRTSQPDLYEQFVATAGAEISKGKSLFEAGAAARPLYLKRFLEMVKTAGDEDINEMLALSRDQMAEALKIEPIMCVKLTRGEADQRVADFPKAMTDRELVLVTHVLRADEQSGAVASTEAVSLWMKDFVGKHSEIVEGLQILSMPAPSPDQARAICQANITLLDGFAAEEPALRAKLYRGILAMS